MCKRVIANGTSTSCWSIRRYLSHLGSGWQLIGTISMHTHNFHRLLLNFPQLQLDEPTGGGSCVFWSGCTHGGKHSVSRLSYLFACLDLLSSETFSFLIFSLLLFSDSSHLCFSSVHIVGSLTSKLPSTMYHPHFNFFLRNVSCKFDITMSHQ